VCARVCVFVRGACAQECVCVCVCVRVCASVCLCVYVCNALTFSVNAFLVAIV